MRKRFIGIMCTIAILILFLCSNPVLAESQATAPQLTAPAPTYNSFWEKLDRLKEDRKLQELVEEDLEKV